MENSNTSQVILIKTSPFHQSFTLLGRSSMAFAIILLLFYSTSSWFCYDASYFGIPAIIVSLLITHYLLRGLESNLSCKLFSFFFKGKPPVIYKHWLKLEENSFSFGRLKLLYSALHNVSLSAFGNLIFKSHSLSGALKEDELDAATTVFKLPFSAILPQTQKDFIKLLQQKCPQTVLSPSLFKVVDKPILKSASYINVLILIIFFFTLIDIGYSTFEYIELLKRYHLSQQSANQQNIDLAQKEYQAAEILRKHCSHFSLIMPKLLNNSSTAANLCDLRSKALWEMGKMQDALESQLEAAQIAPQSFKINLRLARLYAKLGKEDKAKECIDALAHRHKYALLPKLYSASLLFNMQRKTEAKSLLQNYLAFLDKEYFSPPPVWPPGSEDVIHELILQEDLDFLISNIQATSQQ